MASSTGTMAKQPAATGSGFLQAFLALIVVAAIGVGLVMATTNIAWSKAPAADQSYNQVETLRGAAPLTGGTDDRSFDGVEKLRSATSLTGGATYVTSLTGGATYLIVPAGGNDNQSKSTRGVPSHR
jgi:hypothetical protein